MGEHFSVLRKALRTFQKELGVLGSLLATKVNLNLMSSNVVFQKAALASGILKLDPKISNNKVIFILLIICVFFFSFSIGTNNRK